MSNGNYEADSVGDQGYAGAVGAGGGLAVEPGDVLTDLLDDTDVAAGTYYYPSAAGQDQSGYKDMALTGKLVDADGTVTLTVEATNDEAVSDWHDITPAGYRTDNNTIGNANITVTNGTELFAIDFDNLNYDKMRVKVVFSGSTNSATVKERQKTL